MTPSLRTIWRKRVGVSLCGTPTTDRITNVRRRRIWIIMIRPRSDVVYGIYRGLPSGALHHTAEAWWGTNRPRLAECPSPLPWEREREREREREERKYVHQEGTAVDPLNEYRFCFAECLFAEITDLNCLNAWWKTVNFFCTKNMLP